MGPKYDDHVFNTNQTPAIFWLVVLFKVSHADMLRGYCTPGQFLDCLCTFLKNYNTLVASKICFL